MKLSHALVGVCVAIGLGLGAGWWTGTSSARAAEQQKQGEVLIASNRVWIARMDSLKRVAIDAQLEASASAAEATGLRQRRTAAPRLPAGATASDSSAYWHGQAELAVAEADKWHTAYEQEKRATAALTFTRDTLTAKLATTSHALGSSLNREEGHRKILGFIPRPPKLLAAAIGCALGAVVDQHDAARGCGLGGAALVVAAPTR